MPEIPEPPIQYKKLICVEGIDEKNFFAAFLKNIKLHDIDIRDVKGKGNFETKLRSLKNSSGFYKADGSSFVTHMLLIRDKDDKDFKAVFDSITNILQREGFMPPKTHGTLSDGMPKIGVFIMPGKTIKGIILEDLCLKTVETRKEMACVDDFMACLKGQNCETKNISKAKVQAYLAAQPEIVNSLGLGAQKNYWDFDSKALNELKRFLELIR